MSQGGFRSRSKGAKVPNPKRSNPQHQGRGKQGRGQQRGSQYSKRGGFLRSVDTPRAVAFEALRRVSDEGAYANLALPALIKEAKLKGRDAAFATELTYGTLRNQGIIDAVIDHLAAQGIDSISPEVLDAMRLGVYQLLFTRVEAHAAVDTSVNIVAERGREQAKGFVNGVLRQVARTSPEQWIERLSPATPLAAIAFQHAHPVWIARSFARALELDPTLLSTDDAQELERALQADSERPGVHLVARPGEITAEELALVSGGEEGQYSPYAVKLPGGDPGAIEAVQQGMAAVQDEGSQLIANALVQAPVEGPDTGKWLDLCAGPGGKAALIGSLAQIDQATVDAVEVSKHRAGLVRGAVEGLPVNVQVGDGREFGTPGSYDRVLVDAPCSGLGALRRRPEARWRKAEHDIDELHPLQLALLRRALELTREGGVVVYSTCSPDLRETREVVDAVLKEGAAVELDAKALIPTMSDTGSAASVQMWPHRHGTDAMFFAVLRKPISASR
ncbi:RsmB/NOP family class I SAM-dependent RNA methyltransferase [Corynebacterium pseudopelargi]|uniref:Ribosomal RNA small subunit methyltransferase B n=1 Tax=Corynebacterium pseudopelargi TaxID=2080757 RepID=A0A3G6IYJ0_9CORY|nr:transcription antitermination factor NusB [Corynebacterium pseudopelargi]AZA09200.1 Ribosomal RNA small subunit methyltransferase B [Corynebacterium pseudopelargi]